MDNEKKTTAEDRSRSEIKNLNTLTVFFVPLEEKEIKNTKQINKIKRKTFSSIVPLIFALAPDFQMLLTQELNMPHKPPRCCGKHCTLHKVNSK